MQRGAITVTAVPVTGAVRAQLAQIVGSQAFADAEGHRLLLTHLVEATLDGRLEDLQEPSSAELSRLRQRLTEYYLTSGVDAPVQIEVPEGDYVPRFSCRRPGLPEVKGRRLPRLQLPVRRIAVALGVVAALAAAAYLIRPRPPLVAVLPFTDYNASGSAPHRGDWIAEELLQVLAGTPRLRVLSRTSAAAFRGQTADLAEVRRRLGAPWVVEGSVRIDGDRLRIAVRLVDARSGSPVWSGVQTPSPTPVFVDRAVRELAAGVLGALRVEAVARPAPRVPTAEARDRLIQARILAARPDGSGRYKAMERYQDAVTIDPNFARAWGELACHLSQPAFLDSDSAEDYAQRIRHAAARALELDPLLEVPHIALARLAWAREWNWSEAESAWRKALELNPSSAAAHQSYALALATRRRFRDAMAHARQALELDPAGAAAADEMGRILFAARHFDEAATHVRDLLALTPDAPRARLLQGLLQASADRPVEAVTALEAAAAGLARAPEALGPLGFAYARAGRTNDARAVLGQLERAPYARRVQQALVEVGLGDSARALALLDAAAARRESGIQFLGVVPLFDPLRRAPAFAEICRKAGVVK